APAADDAGRGDAALARHALARDAGRAALGHALAGVVLAEGKGAKGATLMYWLREMTGWFLLAVGLMTFYIAMTLLLRDGPFLLEAPCFIAIGFFVFRGGLQLMKL